MPDVFGYFYLLPLCAYKILTPLGNSLRDTCPQMHNLMHNGTSLLSASLSEGEEIFLVLFKTHGYRTFFQVWETFQKASSA